MKNKKIFLYFIKKNINKFFIFIIVTALTSPLISLSIDLGISLQDSSEKEIISKYKDTFVPFEMNYSIPIDKELNSFSTSNISFLTDTNEYIYKDEKLALSSFYDGVCLEYSNYAYNGNDSIQMSFFDFSQTNSIYINSKVLSYYSFLKIGEQLTINERIFTIKGFFNEHASTFYNSFSFYYVISPLYSKQTNKKVYVKTDKIQKFVRKYSDSITNQEELLIYVNSCSLYQNTLLSFSIIILIFLITFVFLFTLCLLYENKHFINLLYCNGMTSNEINKTKFFSFGAVTLLSFLFGNLCSFILTMITNTISINTIGFSFSAKYLYLIIFICYLLILPTFTIANIKFSKIRYK